MYVVVFVEKDHIYMYMVCLPVFFYDTLMKNNVWCWCL